MGHSDMMTFVDGFWSNSLNPCSNGWGTLTFALSLTNKTKVSLNPCSNGWGTLTRDNLAREAKIKGS